MKDGPKDAKDRKRHSHGNYTLVPDFAAFTVPHAVWQAKSQEDKDAAFDEFLEHAVTRKRTATVMSSNSVLTSKTWQKKGQKTSKALGK